MFRKNKKKKTNGGFTLVELLATLALLSVVMSIVVSTSVSVVNKAKEKGYQTTKNNVVMAAGNYMIENSELTGWNTGVVCYGESECHYQCVTVKNLIDTGYFKSDVLESEYKKGTKIQESDAVYIERDITTKTITHKVFDSAMCRGDYTGDISFSVNPKGWSKEKTVTIEYKLGSDADIELYDYSYSYTDGKNKNNQKFSSKVAIESIEVNTNGTLTAAINGMEKVYSVSQIDNTKPSGRIVSQHKLNNNQTVTLTMSDSDSGVFSYYFGEKDPSTNKVTYENVANDSDTVTITREVDSTGTWYLRVMDAVGNYSDVSEMTFYETKFNISNATVEPTRILDENGASYTLPTSSNGINVDSGYSFKGWYDNSSYTGSSITNYTTNGNKTLYGKVTKNVVSKSDGYITLDSYSGSMTYGEKSTLTFNVTSHHGGTLTVSDNSSVANATISGTKITLSNLKTTPVGTVTVTVTSGETTNYNSESATYVLTINEKTETPKEDGYVKLDSYSSSMTYGEKSTLTFNVTSHHGGTLTVSDNSSVANATISGTKITLSNLKTTPVGTVTVTVTSGETTNYNSESATYVLTITDGVDPDPDPVPGPKKYRTGSCISVPNLVYNHNYQNLLTVSCTETVYFSLDTSLNENNYKSASTSSPQGMNAGTYKVYYYFPETDIYYAESGSVTSEIKKAENPIVVQANAGLVYKSGNSNGDCAGSLGSAELQYLVTTQKAVGTVYYSTSDALDEVNFKGSGSASSPQKSDAGTYTVYWYVTGDNNHKSKTGNVTVKIEKANNSTSVTKVDNLVYNGKEQTLVSTSNMPCLSVVYYSIGTELTSSNYSSVGKKTASKATNAGEYVVYWYTPGNSNYKPASGSVTGKIEKADNPISVTGVNKNYTGSSITLVTVSKAQGTVWYSTDNELKSSNYSALGSTTKSSKVSPGTYTVYYYVTGDNNYKSKNSSVTAKINCVKWVCSDGYEQFNNSCCPIVYGTFNESLGDVSFANNTCYWTSSKNVDGLHVTRLVHVGYAKDVGYTTFVGFVREVAWGGASGENPYPFSSYGEQYSQKAKNATCSAN